MKGIGRDVLLRYVGDRRSAIRRDGKSHVGIEARSPIRPLRPELWPSVCELVHLPSRDGKEGLVIDESPGDFVPEETAIRAWSGFPCSLRGHLADLSNPSEP